MTLQPSPITSPRKMAPFPGNKRVFFGHQSVGSNILKGIRSLSPTSPIAEHASKMPSVRSAGLYHAFIGQNQHPHSKIDEFAQVLTQPTATYDYAMMKLCYVDISRVTDIDQLFQYYVAMIRELQAAVPRLQIVHLTIPLRTIRLGVRSRLKLLMGHSVTAVDDNVRREAYNQLIRSRYGDDGYMFDLADFEATRPDGTSNFVTCGDQIIRTLYSGYSDDGGHLNAHGRRMIARQLIRLIDGL